MSENPDVDMKELLIKSCMDSQGKPTVPIEMANEVYDYIIRQVNDFSDTSVVNDNEYAQMLMESVMGLTCLVYITHFDENVEMVIYDPLHTSAKILLQLKLGEVRNGKKRAMKMAEIQSRQQIVMAQR